MKIRLIAVSLLMLLLSSCSYFTQKMNDSLKKAADQYNASADSLKSDILQDMKTPIHDSAYAVKMDTVYLYGLTLATLIDSITANNYRTADIEAYNTVLPVFRNYVKTNFDNTIELSTSLSSLDAGPNIAQSKYPSSIDIRGLMFASAKFQIMAIVRACWLLQYKSPASAPAAK